MYLLLVFAPLLVSSAVYATQSLCDVSAAVISLPSGQTNISQPSSSMKPKYIAAGMGTQNYTCSSSGTYTYMGAYVELVDISCLVTQSSFTTSMRKRNAPFPDSDAVWEHEVMIRAKLGGKSTRFGYSYNQNNPSSNSKTITMFDFRGDYLKNDSQAYMMAGKTGSLASTSTQNFDWTQWDSLQQGDLALRVYSINTYFGMPSASCKAGSPPIQVRYGAEYWFYVDPNAHLETGMASNVNDLSTVQSSTDPNSSALDSGKVDRLLKYAPIFLGLLGLTTALTLILLALGIVILCTRRSSIPTRSAPAYHPVQLPRAREPMVDSYEDKPVPYYGI